MASTTWEYKIFAKNSAEIIDTLANVKLAGRIADKLSAARIIGPSIRHDAINYGPGVTEVHRIRPIIIALEDKIQQNAQTYHQFRGILLSLGADAETALFYMPKKGKLNKNDSMSNRTYNAFSLVPRLPSHFFREWEGSLGTRLQCTNSYSIFSICV